MSAVEPIWSYERNWCMMEATLNRIGPMGLPLEKIEADLPNLPREVRERWAEILLASLDEAHEASEIEDAWDEEAERRWQEYLAGGVEPIPAAQALAALRARTRARR